MLNDLRTYKLAIEFHRHSTKAMRVDSPRREGWGMKTRRCPKSPGTREAIQVRC